MEIRWNLPGKVYLVGAGPGSCKLLTIKALEALQNADVVLHDDLVSEEVLAMLPSRTAIFNVGKRCGNKKVTQEEIHRRMISAARSGQTVVRLKGGDPLIFGRTREEIRALRDAEIEFEIVPGVTAATAAAAAAAIPLTDRVQGSTLIMASNHRCGGKGIRDWCENVVKDATLVFYMPGQHLGQLKEELVKGGLSEETPCLMVSEAAGPRQRILRSVLRDLCDIEALPAPSVLIIGAVVSGVNRNERTTAEDASEVIRIFEAEEASADLGERNNITV